MNVRVSQHYAPLCWAEACAMASCGTVVSSQPGAAAAAAAAAAAPAPDDDDDDDDDHSHDRDRDACAQPACQSGHCAAFQ